MLERTILSIFIYLIFIGIFLFLTFLIFFLTIKFQDNERTERKQKSTGFSASSKSRQFRPFNSGRSRNDKKGIF